MTGTVRVEAVEGRSAVVMSWEHTVHKGDTAAAFQYLMQFLEEAAGPLYVIVDLRKNPTFLLDETFSAALSGPFKHKMLKEWLVVGAGPTARGIGRGLSVVSNRHNIRWYHTMEEALTYLSNPSNDGK